MRNLLLIVALATLSISTAAADSLAPPKRDAISDKPLATKRVGRSNVCAAYGPGFVAVNGGDTCVKVGGSVSVEVNGGR